MAPKQKGGPKQKGNNVGEEVEETLQAVVCFYPLSSSDWVDGRWLDGNGEKWTVANFESWIGPCGYLRDEI